MSRTLEQDNTVDYPLLYIPKLPVILPTARVALRTTSVRAVDAAMKSPERLFFFATLHGELSSEPTHEQICEVGTLCHIKLSQRAGTVYKLIVEGRERATCVQVNNRDGVPIATIRSAPTSNDIDNKQLNELDHLIEDLYVFLPENQGLELSELSSYENLSELVDQIANKFLSFEEKRNILETPSISKRLGKIIPILERRRDEEEDAFHRMLNRYASKVMRSHMTRTEQAITLALAAKKSGGILTQLERFSHMPARKRIDEAEFLNRPQIKAGVSKLLSDDETRDQIGQIALASIKLSLPFIHQHLPRALNQAVLFLDDLAGIARATSTTSRPRQLDRLGAQWKRLASAILGIKEEGGKPKGSKHKPLPPEKAKKRREALRVRTIKAMLEIVADSDTPYIDILDINKSAVISKMGTGRTNTFKKWKNDELEFYGMREVARLMHQDKNWFSQWLRNGRLDDESFKEGLKRALTEYRENLP